MCRPGRSGRSAKRRSSITCRSLPSCVAQFAQENGRNYDIIHSHYWLSGLAGQQLQKKWGAHVPMIQMFHTLGHMKNQVARAAP